MQATMQLRPDALGAIHHSASVLCALHIAMKTFTSDLSLIIVRANLADWVVGNHVCAPVLATTH
jgi:hypothetical protein